MSSLRRSEGAFFTHTISKTMSNGISFLTSYPEKKSRSLLLTQHHFKNKVKDTFTTQYLFRNKYLQVSFKHTSKFSKLSSCTMTSKRMSAAFVHTLFLQMASSSHSIFIKRSKPILLEHYLIRKTTLGCSF